MAEPLADVHGCKSGPLRILTIAACPMPARRGTPVRIERLSEALAARGHRVTVATYHIGEPGAEPGFALQRVALPFEPGTLPPGPTWRKLLLYDPKLFMVVRRLLSRQHFDVIHAHHFEGIIIGALARRRGMPLVYDAHTMLNSELPSYAAPFWRSLVGHAAAILDGLLPRLADHVVCAGAGTHAALVGRHGLPEQRVSIAWNGVELEHFAAAHAARAEATGTADPPRVLYTGTLAGYQDVDLLLRAFALLLETHPKARLVLASNSPFDALRPLARSLGIEPAIDLEVDDFARLPAQLAAATLAALPRRRCDGVPQKLLNYMAAGCPVVASAGSAALLQPETTGLVVADGDVAKFAAAMRRLIDEPATAAAIGARGHAIAAGQLSWNATAVAVERVYARLLTAPAEATNTQHRPT